MDHLGAAVEHARRTSAVRRDPDARELWASVYGHLTRDVPGLTGALIARSEAQTTRLALIYALLDCSHSIRVEHLDAALALWRYAERSVEVVFGDATGDPIADHILAALRQAGNDGMPAARSMTTSAETAPAGPLEHSSSVPETRSGLAA